MDELHHRGELVAVAPAGAERAGREQQQQRAQPLAAAAHDVFGHLADQQHLRIEAGADHRVHGVQVRFDEAAYRFQCHRLGAFEKRGG